MTTNSTNEGTSSSNQENQNAQPSSDFRIEIHAFRNEPEQQQPNTRIWRMNFADVFQGVRPFVQQAHNLRSWRYIPLNNENDNSANVTVGIDLSNGENSQRDITHHHYQSNVGNSINLTDNRNNDNIQRAVASGPSRPLLDRVAALTRNDPPDLIGGSSIQRNDQDGGGDGNNNNNNNAREEGAVAEVFAQIPEARRAFDTLYRYIPLICILLAKSAYDHLEALTDFGVLIGTFVHSNSLVKDQVSKQAQRNILILFREFLFIVFMVFFKFFAINRNNPFICLPLFTSINEIPTLSELLYWVIATDFLLKIITVTIKIFITMIPANVIKYKGRGRYYVLTEALSQLYRSLAPIQLWLFFLLDSYSGMEKILGVTFSAAYMVAKGFDLVDRAKLCKRAFVGFLRQVNYGKIPTKDEIQSAGNQCPICHDNYDTPVKLECNHIFCELCVGTWFTREQTCPLCRAQVAEDPSWQDGGTTHFIQLY